MKMPMVCNHCSKRIVFGVWYRLLAN